MTFSKIIWPALNLHVTAVLCGSDIDRVQGPTPPLFQVHCVPGSFQGCIVHQSHSFLTLGPTLIYHGKSKHDMSHRNNQKLIPPARNNHVCRSLGSMFNISWVRLPTVFSMQCSVDLRFDQATPLPPLSHCALSP